MNWNRITRYLFVPLYTPFISVHYINAKNTTLKSVLTFTQVKIAWFQMSDYMHGNSYLTSFHAAHETILYSISLEISTLFFFWYVCSSLLQVEYTPSVHKNSRAWLSFTVYQFIDSLYINRIMPWAYMILFNNDIHVEHLSYMYIHKLCYLCLMDNHICYITYDT